jgi:hypothetical protein
VQLSVATAGPFYLSGTLGVSLPGAPPSFIDLSRPDSCSETLSYTGAFGEVDCSAVRSGENGGTILFTLVLRSWPSPPLENNFFYNDGNPSRYDFYCDTSLVTRFTDCIFTDVYVNNVKGF